MEPIYRIVPLTEWPRIETNGKDGPIDKKDGFIHAAMPIRSSADPLSSATNPWYSGPPETLKREYVEEREAVFTHLYAPASR